MTNTVQDVWDHCGFIREWFSWQQAIEMGSSCMVPVNIDAEHHIPEYE